MWIEFEFNEMECERIKEQYKQLKELGAYSEVCNVLHRLIQTVYDTSLVDRNRMIFAMRETGSKYKDIANMFGLSVERCRQIYSKERHRTELAQKIIEQAKEKPDFGCCINIACVQLNRSKRIAIRTYNSLARVGIIKAIESGGVTLDNYTDDDLLRIVNFGEVQLEVCRKADNIYRQAHSVSEPIEDS